MDLDDSKGDMGTQFGITHFVNPSNGDDDLVAHLVESTGWGADYTFDATGNVNVRCAALELSNKGWGESIIIGVAPAGAEISTGILQLLAGRVWPLKSLRKCIRAYRCTKDCRLVHAGQN